MIKIALENVLKKKKKTKYWLIQKTGCTFNSLTKLINNEASAIYFDTLEKVCIALECEPKDIIKLEKITNEKEYKNEQIIKKI